MQIEKAGLVTRWWEERLTRDEWIWRRAGCGELEDSGSGGRMVNEELEKKQNKLKRK